MADRKPWSKNAKALRDKRRISNCISAGKIAHYRRYGASIRTTARLVGLSVTQVRRYIEEATSKTGNPMNEDIDFLNKRFPRSDAEHEKRLRALHMRQEGYTYKEIALHLGTNDVTAQRWVTQEIQAIEALESFDTKLLTRQALMRLDELSKNLWVQVDNGGIKAVLALLKIEERRSKLLGLDAPTLINIEDKAREAAEKAGLDPEEVLARAHEILQDSRHPSE